MWVARDKDGHLFIWNKLPYRGHDSWEYNGVLVHWLEIDSSLFPDLKWEDEPIEVELIEKEHIEDTKEIQCTFCDKTFSYSVEDMISVKSLVGNYKMVTCPHCNSKNFL